MKRGLNSIPQQGAKSRGMRDLGNDRGLVGFAFKDLLIISIL